MTAHVLHSDLLAAHGIPHGFSTRVGGVSGGVFESLNLGNPSELPAAERDPARHIQENYRRILEAMGCAGRTVTEVHQVHGGAVHVVANPPPGCPAPLPGPDPKADAVITDDARRVVAIRVADCAPVLLSTPDGSLVAAVHAGWRGVIARALPNTVDAMRTLGARELLAAIGPCIGPDRFEVGAEVATQFRRAFSDADSEAGPGNPPVLRAGREGRSLVNLQEALRRQLSAWGVLRCERLPRCVHTEAALFYSHRRDGGRTGRMAGVIGPKAGPLKPP